MTAAHTLTVHFNTGNTERVTVECHLNGADRPCAVITCPVDHEDVSRACIREHGARAVDACWAEDWAEMGREWIYTQALPAVSVPVHISYETGLVVLPVEEEGKGHAHLGEQPGGEGAAE